MNLFQPNCELHEYRNRNLPVYERIFYRTPTTRNFSTLPEHDESDWIGKTVCSVHLFPYQGIYMIMRKIFYLYIVVTHIKKCQKQSHYEYTYFIRLKKLLRDFSLKNRCNLIGFILNLMWAHHYSIPQSTSLNEWKQWITGCVSFVCDVFVPY